MRNIMEIVYLIHILDSDDYTKTTKVANIKYHRDKGNLTEDEAIDLAAEYFT